MSVSVLILTKNEERDLPGCLATVAWCDDVHVLDSASTDRTREIAAAAGATVSIRQFDDWSTHQNWALANLAFAHPWVLYIDADERVSPELALAVRAAAAAPGDHVAFRVRRRDFLLGRWLRRVQATAWYPRLFRPAHLRYERLVNPVSRIDGPAGVLTGYLDHFPFSKGVDFWFERHNRYSRLEAEQILLDRAGHSRISLFRALFDRDASVRRHHQKQLFYRLPCRPLVKFLGLYLAKGGFLDGRPGLMYAQMMACYERMIVIKVLELEAKQHKQPTRATTNPA